MKKFFFSTLLFFIWFNNLSAFPTHYNGQGNLAIPEKMIKEFHTYIKTKIQNNPLNFFITADHKNIFIIIDKEGRYKGYSPSGPISRNKKKCEQKFKQECFLFANQRIIVWNNGINPIDSKKSKIGRKSSYEELVSKLDQLGFLKNQQSQKITEKKNSNKDDDIKKQKSLSDEDKAATEKKLAEDKAATEKKLAEDKAAKEKKLAEDQKSQEKKLNDEIKILTDKRMILSIKPKTGLSGLDFPYNVPLDYYDFKNKEILIKSKDDFKYWDKTAKKKINCGKLLDNYSLKSDLTGKYKLSTENCSKVKKEISGIWKSKEKNIAFAYSRKNNVFVDELNIDFDSTDVYAKTCGNNRCGGTSYYKLISYKDLESGNLLGIGRKEIKKVNAQKALATATEKKMKLFGVKLFSDPKSYKLSNKKRIKEAALYGNTLTEIMEADYGQKLEYNYYDIEPPIKNEAFFNYSAGTTFLNGKEIISSIEANANCPKKGFSGCEEFSIQIENALYEKYEMIANEPFEFQDEKGNIYRARLTLGYTVNGKIAVAANMLNANGIFLILFVSWEQDDLMKKFEIDEDSRKKIDTNF